MSSLTIRPLDTGTMVSYPKSELVPLTRFRGVMIDVPIIMWYIEGGEEKIIVDTSFKRKAIERVKMRGMIVERNPEQEVEAALAKVGLKPEEVDTVILTHLHWDHCQNNAILKNARFIVQREELRYAVAPLPPHAAAFEAPNGPFWQQGTRPSWLEIRKFEIVSGDQKIIDGVSVIFTPGHTPGHQSVAVETAEGTYILAGDFLPLYENWEGVEGVSLPHIPTTIIHSSMEKYWWSLGRIEKIPDSALPGHVLPGHDIGVLEREKYP